jgi:hypothetical protein
MAHVVNQVITFDARGDFFALYVGSQGQNLHTILISRHAIQVLHYHQDTQILEIVIGAAGYKYQYKMDKPIFDHLQTLMGFPPILTKTKEDASCV